MTAVLALLLIAPAAWAAPRNLILVAIDTLRPDHTGLYGYPRPTTPHLDRLGREGVLFEKAYSQATWCLPSYASLLTSRYVPSHGVFRLDHKLPDSLPALASVFQERGYRTAAFVTGIFLRPEYGFQRGFDLYWHQSGGDGKKGSVAEVLPQALAWLKEQTVEGGRSFFLFLNAMDLHEPWRYSTEIDHRFDPSYRGLADDIQFDFPFQRAFNHLASGLPWQEGWGPAPTPDYLKLVGAVQGNPRDLAHIVAHYDGGIAYVDAQLGRLWKALDGHDLWKDTVVAVVSDHGEGLGEHKNMGHSGLLYDELLRIAWVLRHPDPSLRGVKVSQAAQLIDAAPTLLGMLGLSAPNSFQGRALDPRRQGPEQDAYATGTEFVGPQPLLTAHSVRRQAKKLVWHHQAGSVELYDTEKDPGELQNVGPGQAAAASSLMRTLLEHLEEARPAPGPPAGAPSAPPEAKDSFQISPDVRESLRRMGYLVE